MKYNRPNPAGTVVLALVCWAGYMSGLSAQDAAVNQQISVPLYDDLGDYHYPITTSEPLAQRYFDQGLRLYYAFNHAEAVRAFRAAQQLDADCAMCYWAEALAWGPNINLPMDTPSAQAAYEAIQQAQDRADGESASEKAMIAALAVRYDPGAPEDRAHLDQAYADAMADVAASFPDDMDISALYAEALMDLRPWDYWTEDNMPQPGMDVALSHLQRVIEANEKHPGACHFYIHAVEAVYPERAVECAERLAGLMPGAGHLVHMPGHIYIRVGRYLDAVNANEHAVHADETYIQDQHPGMGMYTAGYYPHNYDFMAFAAMMIGRSDTAIDSAERVTSLLPPEMFGAPGMDFLQHWSMRPQLMRVRFARWQEILNVPEPAADRLHARALWHYATGRARLATGDIAGADRELGALREIAQNPGLVSLKMEFNQSTDLIAIAERVLTGWREMKAGNTEAGISALESAVQLEGRLFYGEPPEWSIPVRQDFGSALLLADRPEQAELVFLEDLAKFPDNGWSLYGLKQALTAQGKSTAAASTGTRLQRIWSTADVDIADIFQASAR